MTIDFKFQCNDKVIVPDGRIGLVVALLYSYGLKTYSVIFTDMQAHLFIESNLQLVGSMSIN